MNSLNGRFIPVYMYQGARDVTVLWNYFFGKSNLVEVLSENTSIRDCSLLALKR